MRHLFIDIETLGHEPEKNKIQPPKNYKSDEAIEKYRNENLDKIWRENALKSLHCDVICVGYAFDSEPVEAIYGDEKDMFIALDAILAKGDNPEHLLVVAHNGLNFDFPILRHRAIKYGLKTLFNVLDFKNKYDPRVQDTQALFAGTDYKGHYSLDNIAKFLGIEGKSEGIDGAKVHDYFLDGRIKEIADYCRQDVEVLRNVYNKLNQF